MKHVAVFLSCLLLILAPACALYTRAKEIVDQGEAMIEKLEFKVDSVDKFVASLERAIGDKMPELIDQLSKFRGTLAAADKNSDGTIKGFNEWWAVILAAAGALGLTRNDKKRSETAGELHEKTNSLAAQFAEIRGLLAGSARVGAAGNPPAV